MSLSQTLIFALFISVVGIFTFRYKLAHLVIGSFSFALLVREVLFPYVNGIFRDTAHISLNTRFELDSDYGNRKYFNLSPFGHNAVPGMHHSHKVSSEG